jgi:hypothetical protein
MTEAERRLAQLQTMYSRTPTYDLIIRLADARAEVNREHYTQFLNPERASLLNSARFWGRSMGQTPMSWSRRSTAPIVGITRDPMKGIFRNVSGREIF